MKMMILTTIFSLLSIQSSMASQEQDSEFIYIKLKAITDMSQLKDQDCMAGIYCSPGGSAHHCSNVCDLNTCGRAFSFCLPQN